ncbi:MAG TPA: NAD-dependent epimerase/dehydratase family protein [Thermoleophilaceae bacterium]|nr:NAD-dependent epimerase/dehydratase family protein [Thermoleophilaceae bacterium]
MKVVVTGAAGFIGSHLVEESLRRGWEVVAIDSLTTYYSPAAKIRNTDGFRRHPRCTYLERDILDVDLPTVLEGSAVVFHLAAQAGVRASWGQSFDVYTHLNITVLQRLLEAARHSDALERFIFASSSSVYGDAESLPTTEDQVLRPVSPYGATKALGEHLTYLYFRNYAVPTVNLRYFSVYGPRQRPDMAFHRAIEAALRGEEFELFGDGAQTRDFTYVADIVTGTIAAAASARPGSTYNLGGGGRAAMHEALDMIGAEVGSALSVARAPGQRGDTRATAADITAAEHDLDYAPGWTLVRGLREQVAWHRARATEGGGKFSQDAGIPGAELPAAAAL